MEQTQLFDSQLFDFSYEICIELFRDKTLSKKDLQEFENAFSLLKEPLKNTISIIMQNLIDPNLVDTKEKQLIVITFLLVTGFWVIFLNMEDSKTILQNLGFFNSLDNSYLAQ